MPTIPLTDTGLKKKIADCEKNLILGEKATNRIPDGGGLGLKRLNSGNWVWHYRYRFEGKENVLSFGHYPATTLAEARAQRDEVKRLQKEGKDPAAYRDAQRAAVQESKAAALVEPEDSFRAVALLWHSNWSKGKGIDAAHATATLRRLENDVFPALGMQSVQSIELKHLTPVLKAIEQRAPSLAEKAWIACGQVFRYACAHGIMSNNPCANIRRGDLLMVAPQVENQKRVNPEEIPALMRAIDSYESVLVRLALQLMALVFVRHSELIGARWCDFDFEHNLWTIPIKSRDEHGNSGYGMKKVRGAQAPHVVPLSRQALAVLEQLRAINGGRVHLFPSVKGEGKVMSMGTMNKALELMGFKGRHTVHGFKGMASTALSEMGYPREHIELQLAHMERNKVVAAYNHAKYIKQRTEMMQRWADFLDEQRGKGKVIPMRRA
ncbi:MAG: tyrosine-type recombinase/integrase [Formosimonas sp.]